MTERVPFDNPYFRVIERIIINPDGSARDAQLLWDRRGRTFAIAVGLTPEGKYVLVEEPKYGQMKRMLSFPTGGVKKAESPLEAAAREFEKETGYRADSWELLRETPLVDFADKIDGGEHFVYFGKNAERVGTPEAGRKTILLSRNDLDGALDGLGPTPHRIEIAMQVAAAYLAFMYIDRMPIAIR